jgi:hypothetical protein
MNLGVNIMSAKKKLEKQLKHRRRQTNDLAEFSEIGNVTDDKLRREIGSLVDDLKLVDNNYLKFVKKHSKFGKDGVEGEYNKQMLDKARAERVKAQIERYQQTMARGVNGMAIAKIVGHVAINAVFNKQFRDDFKQLFRKPIERTAQNLAKSKGQNVVLGGLSNGTHIPFDARSAALTELAQTLKFNEDMRNTKDPAKREWLIKSYTESLGSLYEWAGEDGVSGDSIRRMRNVLIDADLRSDHPKFKHLYENLHNVERDCQRVDFFEHMDVGVFVWEGDFKDSKTGDSFEMIVNAPEYGEPIDKIIDVDLEYGVESYIDEKAVVDDAVEISKAENEADFEKRLNPNYNILNWSDEKDLDVPEQIDFSRNPDETKFKSERSLEIGSWDSVSKEIAMRRIPEEIADDLVIQRFSPIVSKARWEDVVKELTNQAEKSNVHLNGKYIYNGNGYTSNEHLQRQAEYELVDMAFDKHLSKRLAITDEMVTQKKDGYNVLDLDLNSMDVNVNFITRERVRRQEREIIFDETKEALSKFVAKTPTLTDDELLEKLELAQAEAGVGASLVKDMEDLQIGN